MDFVRCRHFQDGHKMAEKHILHISLLLDMLEFNVVRQNVHFRARPIELRYSRLCPMSHFQDGRQNGEKLIMHISLLLNMLEFNVVCPGVGSRGRPIELCHSQ